MTNKVKAGFFVSQPGKAIHAQFGFYFAPFLLLTVLFSFCVCVYSYSYLKYLWAPLQFAVDY